MKKIAVILALALAITAGMALTTAFALVFSHSDPCCSSGWGSFF